MDDIAGSAFLQSVFLGPEKMKKGILQKSRRAQLERYELTTAVAFNDFRSILYSSIQGTATVARQSEQPTHH
jgi:hypothetical protein